MKRVLFCGMGVLILLPFLIVPTPVRGQESALDIRAAEVGVNSSSQVPAPGQSPASAANTSPTSPVGLPGQPPTAPPYKMLRDEEDWSFLRDATRRSDFWDPLKYVPLNRRGDRYLSFGGETRQRYEYFHNRNAGLGPQDPNGYFLQRYMLHADLHWGPRLRLFTQLKSGIESGKFGGPAPPDENTLDFNQVFLDAVLPFGAKRDGVSRNSLTLRLGRQEINYGTGRLISVREGPNTRVAFDGARMVWKQGQRRVDVFSLQPVEDLRGRFDDGTTPGHKLRGIYGTQPLRLVKGGNIDLYYLDLYRALARFDQGTGREKRHSVGTRLWGKHNAWDYNFEAGYQWGRFGSGQIRAWALASDTGHTWKKARYSPRLSLKADIISGDLDPADRDLQAFNPLFPRGNYFGELGFLGPYNLIDVHPALSLQLNPRLSILLDWDFFWRQSTRDGIYGNPGNLLRPGKGSRARFIGHSPAATLTWQANRHLTVSAGYGRFFAGPFLKESPPSRDINFFSTFVTYKF